MVTSICMTVEFLTQNSYPSTLCFAIMTMQHIKKTFIVTSGVQQHVVLLVEKEKVKNIQGIVFMVQREFNL